MIRNEKSFPGRADILSSEIGPLTSRELLLRHYQTLGATLSQLRQEALTARNVQPKILLIAREINALRLKHPEILKQSQPPPVLNTSRLSERFGQAATFLASVRPSSRTVSQLTAQLSAVAALGLAFPSALDQNPVAFPLAPPAILKASKLPPLPRHAVRPMDNVQKPSRMDDLFKHGKKLDLALAEFEEMPVREAFKKAVLQESGNRQLDAEGNVLTSQKGALGASQIMPATAEHIAQDCTGKPLDAARLKTDKRYNKALGECYFTQQYDTFGSSPVLAGLAYNMGPDRVARHIKRVGDPTKGEIAMADFLKAVSITESRHYVLHLLKASELIDSPEKTSGKNPQPQPSQ